MASLKDLIVMGPARFLDKLYGNLEGNATSADKLKTARSINGTNFDGTTAITTANWGTARNFTIGNTTKSVNGSAAMSWTLSEIGAVAKAGDTMTGKLTGVTTNFSWIGITRNGAFRTETAASGGSAAAVVSMKTASGSWAIGNLTGNDNLYFVFGTDTNYSAGTNSTSTYYITTGGAFSGSANKLTTARTINGTSFDGSSNITTANWGTARTVTIGNTGKSVNGSSNISWSLAEIGAIVSNAWETGTSAGPKIKTTVNGVTGTAVAIPSASISASGIVTTGTQRFRGKKFFEYPAFTSNGSRYLGWHYYHHNGSTVVGEHWYDVGDNTNITTGIFNWRQYSPNSTANTSTTGYYETFYLPAVTVGRTAHASYEIFTSKNYDTLDGRYVNVTGDTVTGSILFEDESGSFYKINRKKADGGGWAYSPIQFRGSNNVKFANIGAYGGQDTLSYLYIGVGEYDSTYNLRISPLGAVSTGGTITSSSTITGAKLVISSTSATQHIALSRPGWNYITSPADSTIAFVPTGSTIGDSYARLAIDSSAVFPGANNGTINLGTNNYKWNNVYGNSFTGNAASATKLQTARTINGTSFNGTANITTAKWGNSRTITASSGDIVGSFTTNGSANVSYRADLNYLCCYRGNVAGKEGYKYHRILSYDTTSNHQDVSAILILDRGYLGGGFGIAKVAIRVNNITGGADAVISIKWLVRSGLSANCLQGGVYYNTTKAYVDFYYYATDSWNGITIRVLEDWRGGKSGNQLTLYNSSVNESTLTNIYSAMNYRAYTTTVTSGSDESTVNNAYSASILSTARTFTIGNTGKSFNGSANVSWSLAEIGAVAKAGDTLTGALNFKNSTWNAVGDDVYFGDNDTAGSFAIMGKNGTTNLKMVKYNDTSSYGTISWDGTFFASSAHLKLAAAKHLYMAYNGTNYSVLHNYNNGRIGLNACGGGVYIGYSNTTGVHFGPSAGWGSITSSGYSGNAATATKATQDANGNNIASTYLRKDLGFQIFTTSFIPSYTTAGWYRLARISGLKGYFAGFITITGGWNSGEPASAILAISAVHQHPSITQIGGTVGSTITEVRLTGESGSYYLEIYCNTVSGAIATQYATFFGCLNVTETQSPTSPNGSLSTYTAYAKLEDRANWNYGATAYGNPQVGDIWFMPTA